jgi:hypothetical protein
MNRLTMSASRYRDTIPLYLDHVENRIAIYSVTFTFYINICFNCVKYRDVNNQANQAELASYGKLLTD